jgi:hypothetical protein
MPRSGLRNRVERLMRQYADPADCDGGATVILRYRKGEPEPPTPPDAPRCRRCGRPHVLLLEEVLVEVTSPAPPEDGILCRR